MVHLLYMSMCSSEVSPRLTMSRWSVHETCQGNRSNIILFQEYSFQITLRQQWNDKRLRFDEILSSRGVESGNDMKPRYDMIEGHHYPFKITIEGIMEGNQVPELDSIQLFIPNLPTDNASLIHAFFFQLTWLWKSEKSLFISLFRREANLLFIIIRLSDW